MLHFTGRSRPLNKVGLAPRQYTEWNEVGHAHSAGDHSQQGLLPEVRCTACTKCMFTKMTKNQRPRALSPGGLYSWWHFASPANRSRSHDCALVTWAYGAPCPAMVSPNTGLCNEDKLLYPDCHLIWCVESGFRPAQNVTNIWRNIFATQSNSFTEPHTERIHHSCIKNGNETRLFVIAHFLS